MTPGGSTVQRTLRAGQNVSARTRRAGRFVARHVGRARNRGGAGDQGMMRLLDLHAASCAGDTLIAVGLAGTIFFSAPAAEARGRVGLYLIMTMAPFALLAPVVGPLLDRFRHGRRYALAVTMLGRAFLAWIISDNLHDWALYPTAFGVLALSRAYGVARSAAVPRLLPVDLGLVEAGARASLWGTVAGAIAAPLGAVAYAIGPQWTLRLATVVFVIGMVIALRLPPKADSDPPETVPRIFQLPSHRTARVLSGPLVWETLFGSAVLRGLYGFLTLYSAFRVRADDFAGSGLGQAAALGVIAIALAGGSFLATLLGSRLTIHRPLPLQTAAVGSAAVATILATIGYSLYLVALACFVGAVASGLAKLAADAVIQERLPESVRANAFAHSETLLILAWVFGGALGLIPVPGPVAYGVVSAALAAATVRLLVWSRRLRRERLTGAIHPPPEPAEPAGTVDLARGRSAATVDLARRASGPEPPTVPLPADPPPRRNHP